MSTAMGLRQRGIRPTNELYYQYKSLLEQLARRFQRRYGGFLPDIQSEAEEFFLIACKDWDRERDFATWVRFVVWKTLLTRAKARATRNAVFRREFPDLSTLRQKSRFRVSQLLMEISDDAATLVKLALVPRELKKESPNQRREALIGYLLEQGWETSRLCDAIKEVQRALI